MRTTYRKAYPLAVIVVMLSLLLPNSMAGAHPSDGPSATPAEYRRWIREAHNLYPYRETERRMTRVMYCESGGNPRAVGPWSRDGGRPLGLFQYKHGTWEGTWNPYRGQSIYDARAQIFATAKAWYEGHQSWWACYWRTQD